MGWLLLAQWLVAAGAWAALTISPSPSTDGSYKVSWTQPAATSISTKLYEKVGSGSWSLEGTYGSTIKSKSFSGKAAGTYSYKTEQCYTGFGSTSCWASEGPTSVTVSAAATPAPTASMNWNPSTVDSGESSTLSWSSTNATSCTINGNTRATSGSWTTTPTRTRTDTLICTGAGGTTGSVTATLTVNTPASASKPDAPAKPTVTPGNEELSVSWSAPDNNGAAITDYDVRYKRSSVTSWSSHSFSGTGTSTTIDDLTNGTAYQVQVRAQNSAGESNWSSSATATPRGKPARPARPTLSAGNGELEVEWTAPANNGAAITDYDVRYKRTSATSWSSHSFSGTGTSTTIDDLTNGTAYNVQVRAQNAAGESSWSASGTATPVATGLSMSVSPSPSTDGSYTVSWTLARCFNAYNTQVCRTLQERVGSSGSWSAVSGVGTSATSHDFSGKTDGTTYYYRLVFGSGSNAVVVGGPVSVTVDEADPPDAPAAPTLGEGDGQLTVSWTAPDDNGSAITGYEVQYKRNLATVTTWSKQTAAASATSATIGSLTNGLEYAVRVRAKNAGGWSDESDSTTGTPRGKPAKPAAPTLGEGDGQLTVSWTAPDDNGSAITGYEVQYKRNLATVTTWSKQTAAASATSATIGSLTNGLEYAVRVRAKNAGGWSDESDSTTGTPRGKPAKPAAPTLGEGDGQLTVSWTAPDDNGSAITDYDVRYKRSSASSWRNHAFSGTGTSTTIDNLTNDVEYEVQVLATNARGDSAWSDSGTGTPTSGEVAPPTPTGLTGPAAGAVTDPYTISWNTATGATYYELRERMQGGDWTEYNTGSTTSKTFTGQESGSWDYRVRACNATGCSNWSATFTVVVPGLNGVPGVPGPDSDQADQGVECGRVDQPGQDRHPARRVPGGGERRGHLQHPADAGAGHGGRGPRRWGCTTAASAATACWAWAGPLTACRPSPAAARPTARTVTRPR